MDLIYRDLRRLAAYCLASERQAQTLQATALVHETYLRISSLRGFDWKGRTQFISVVTQIMRRVLVDHARARRAAKRDPALFEASPALGSHPLDVLAVDEALTEMLRLYPRCGQIVELRFFGDLDFKEIAEVLDVSIATVERDWRFSRAWLQERITRS